ncbi:MAG: hypothetical protein ABIR25_02570 [Sphingomicrobium sp.]
MNNMTLMNRSGLAAIAAATVLLSTPAMAQEAAPVTADPAPLVADTPLPTESTPAPEAVSDPLAPTATTTTTTTRTTRTTRSARATTAPPARSARAPAPMTVAPTASVAPTAPLAEATPPFDPAMVAPLPEPIAATPVAAADSTSIDDVLPIAGAAGLGILALAGVGFAMRRRRREEDVMVDETFREPAMNRAGAMPIVAAPVATAPITVAAPLGAKPVFNWGNAPRETAPSLGWIEAARRGPTPDNPSLSLKKRLQRAAFFDRRERQVAAGMAEPVSPMAGLPDALATLSDTKAHAVRRPVRGVGMSFGRTFQPA